MICLFLLLTTINLHSAEQVSLQENNPMHRFPIPLCLSSLLLGACMSSGGDYVVNAPIAAEATAQNTLPHSGQGNSGGVVSAGTTAPAAGVEATMSYNAGGRGAGARVDFHNGPMTGVGIRCTRAGGGATVPECEAINARKVWLVNEMSGKYAYVAGFAIEGYGPNTDQNSFVTIHSGPGLQSGEAVQLPGASVQYSGRFQAGAALTTGGQTYEGSAIGSVNMVADFNSGQLSAVFQGLITDGTSGLATDLSAGFEDASIGPDGRFFNSDGTLFSYAGQQAWGELDGAFYGPNAEEAGATFGFGNTLGGMTGVAIGCSEYNAATCIAPNPRF